MEALKLILFMFIVTATTDALRAYLTGLETSWRLVGDSSLR